MSKRTVFNIETFDFEKHYIGIYYKLSKFLKDFDIEEYINFKITTGLNNCYQCHIQIDEPKTHEQAKTKLFKLFVNHPDYLVESELRANKDLIVPGKGTRNYQFDNLVIHVNNFLSYMNIVNEFIRNSITLDDLKKEKPKLDIETLKELEQGLIFAVEADGGGHSEQRDAIRDRFFISNYNIVTVRYAVSDLVQMEESKKLKKLRLKYNAYKEFSNLPMFHNITSEQIVAEAKNIYRSKYLHIK